ncbi:MAG: hypothetical protein EAZ13_00695 [Sphingobacteriia bacterium]|nr:MAG: hypothetical protein EAZ13_00695 [Sphingobacteriia bacterium]
MAHLLYFAPKECFMSYNYLPLDRNLLHFQQLKDLLDYQQLVSITFNAHENILAHTTQHHQIMEHKDADLPQMHLLTNNLIVSKADGFGGLIPTDIVKLMLMFKIKSLSCGKYFVQIATVIRLMDIYNQNILPVVYTQSKSGDKSSALCHLLMPLLGLGKVYYKGNIVDANQVLKKYQWEPIQLKHHELLQLTNGEQYISAYGIYCLIKAQTILTQANSIAAKLPASIAQAFIEAQQIFEQTLRVFMQEINSVTESTNKDLSIYLNNLTIAMQKLVNIPAENIPNIPTNFGSNTAPGCLAQIENIMQKSDAFFIPYLRKN